MATATDTANSDSNHNSNSIHRQQSAIAAIEAHKKGPTTGTHTERKRHKNSVTPGGRGGKRTQEQDHLQPLQLLLPHREHSLSALCCGGSQWSIHFI